MKFFKNLLGFSDDYEQEDSIEQTTQNTPYINPFKKETPKEAAPANTTSAAEKAAQEAAFSDIITSKIIEILNAGLPEYARTSIDIKAEKAYVEKLLGETISNFVAKIKDSATEDNKSKWQADLLSLEKDKATAEKTVAEMTAKIQELRTRIQNSDSQKEIFKEKSKQLENKINTVIAERDQFELECKSLMNKIKVAAINEQNVTALTDENQKLSAENVNLHAEILKLRNEKGVESNDEKINEANAKIAEKDGIIAENNAAIATKDAKIESLKAQIESLTAQNTQNAKANEIIEGLQNQVKSLADSNYSLQEQINTLKETESALNEQIATLRSNAESNNNDEIINALAAKDAEIATKDATITELNSKVNDLSIVAGDKTSEIDRLNENTSALNETINKLREEINAANEAQHNQELTFRSEIDKLQKANEELIEELQKAKKPIETITFEDKPEVKGQAVAEPEISFFEEEKPAKASRGRKKKVVSAIDYTTKDYTDWLMPTPPSLDIPIDEELEEKPEKPTKPQPSQMELF